MVLPLTGDEGLHALARVAPYLLCREGKLPRINQAQATFALDPETGSGTIFLMDDANEVALPFEFPLTPELPPSRVFKHALMCAYATFN